MDLSTEIFRTRGRAAKPLNATVTRELDTSDLALLQQERGIQASPVKRISERHHALARALATGKDHKQVSAIYGYSESRISILLSDPAFKELLSFYRAEDTEVVRDLGMKMAEAASTAMDLIQDRLEENGDDVSFGQLMEVAKMGADRTGYGPQSSSTNVNVNVDLASRLQAARQRIAARTIEG